MRMLRAPVDNAHTQWSDGYLSMHTNVHLQIKYVYMYLSHMYVVQIYIHINC